MELNVSASIEAQEKRGSDLPAATNQAPVRPLIKQAQIRRYIPIGRLTFNATTPPPHIGTNIGELRSDYRVRRHSIYMSESLLSNHFRHAREFELDSSYELRIFSVRSHSEAS
jgi:hypothetical protein